MMNTKIKLSFQLNDMGRPTDCEPYTRTEANSLVEEVRVSDILMLSS